MQANTRVAFVVQHSRAMLRNQLLMCGDDREFELVRAGVHSALEFVDRVERDWQRGKCLDTYLRQMQELDERLTELRHQLVPLCG